jgi:hypothetical protein
VIVATAVLCAAYSSGGKPTVVSAECDAALKAVANAGSDRPDSETVLLLDAILTACQSKAEWIAGAKTRPG